MAEWTPLPVAAAAVLGATLAAIVSLRVNRTRIEADAQRESSRWLAEQRITRYVRAHDVQRDLAFTANGTLKLHIGRRRAFLEANETSLYNYGRWLSVLDDLQSVAASLRMLGANDVAAHLTDALSRWRTDDIRTAMRDFEAGITAPPIDLHDSWSRSQGEGMSQYLDRADEMVERGRRDILELTGEQHFGPADRR